MMVRAQIEINTTEDLQAVALDAYYNQNTYKLTADLDLADIPWMPRRHGDGHIPHLYSLYSLL